MYQPLTCRCDIYEHKHKKIAAWLFAVVVTHNLCYIKFGQNNLRLLKRPGARPVRGINLVKLIKVIDMLARHRGATVEQIAEELEIDRTNVYKWLRIVEEELGFPILSEKDPLANRTRKRLDKDFYQKMGPLNLPDVKLTAQELLALFFLKGEAHALAGSGIEENIATAFAKIALFAPRGLAEKLEKLQAIFLLDAKKAKNYRGKEEIITALSEAMLAGLTCNISYHAFQDGKVKKYKIDPLHFFEQQGGIYLFVNTTSYGDIRVLALERILSVEPTEESFIYPADFDPTERLKQTFGLIYDAPITVEIWFSRSQAPYIRERSWAAEQEITSQADGAIILKFKASGRSEIKRWVLGYGAQAKVLTPEDLREEIIAEINQTRTAYLF